MLCQISARHRLAAQVSSWHGIRQHCSAFLQHVSWQDIQQRRDSSGRRTWLRCRGHIANNENQRHLNASRVKRIAAEFDERIANAPKVSYRDGHYYVFDGQHTIAARKLLNNNSDLNIVCKVYSGLTEQEEALLFAQQTGISAPLTAGAKLRAKIHGGDPEAIAFQSATQRAGFGLSFNQSHAKWKIACIATAFGEYRQHGERIYTDALRVLAEAWEGDIDSLRSEVLQGVVRFIALYDHEYDPVRLIRQLKRTSPVTIYRSGQAMSGPNYQKYMHQILKAYNGSSRTKSLPIKQ